MYEPARPRSKKTEIVRSRSGCKVCRERHKKCDEKKPTCGVCARLGTACEQVKQIRFRMVTGQFTKPATQSQQSRQDHNATFGKDEARVSHRYHTDVAMGIPSSSNIPPLPGLQVTQGMQRLEKEMFYFAHWENSCLPALNPIFMSISRLVGRSLALKDTVLALSSCNFSRMKAEQKYSSATRTMGAFTPDLTHLTRSQLYYSSAVRGFMRLCQQRRNYDASSVLAVIVLFAYIESTMGNFKGFYCHIQGLSALMDVEGITQQTDPLVKGLLTAWMQPQYLLWWARAYFSSVEVQLRLPSVTMPRFLMKTLGTLWERRIVVLNIMCESHRLNLRAALRHWGYPTGAAASESGGIYPAYGDEIAQCCARLVEQSRRLDDWLLQLPPSERPVGDGASDDAWRPHALDRPLMFETHDAALNYAYYVSSRIMQCTGLLHLIRTRDPNYLGRECYEEEPWVRLFLRIIRGIHLETCSCQNTYTIGFSALILAVLLRCQDLRCGRWIERWLQSLEEVQPTEEGSFPVYQSLAVAKAINRQRAEGRDVFVLSLPVDDRGGTPKFSSYNSQAISTLVAYGKLRNSGDLFTDCIRVGDMGSASSAKCK